MPADEWRDQSESDPWPKDDLMEQIEQLHRLLDLYAEAECHEHLDGEGHADVTDDQWGSILPLIEQPAQT
jgi:hypothetical protein